MDAGNEVEVAVDEVVVAGNTAAEEPQTVIVPDEADFIYCYSTPPGMTSQSIS